MNSKGDLQIKALEELAVKNNFTVAFLRKQISLGRLAFKKKDGAFYSTQSWIDAYKKDFTFLGFMIDRIFSENKTKDVSTPRKNSIIKTNKGKIIREGKINMDIEEAFVKKWNNEFRKIHKQFDGYIKENQEPKKTKRKFKNLHNIHSAVVAVAIMFLISFYSVNLMPNATEFFTKKIDLIVKTPYDYINQLALTNIIDENAVFEDKPLSSEQLSNYIKNKTANISFPAGTSMNINKKDIIGRVAGIEEEYVNDDNLKFFDKFKKASFKVFTKISEKQKRASLELNKKLNNFISLITE